MGDHQRRACAEDQGQDVHRHAREAYLRHQAGEDDVRAGEQQPEDQHEHGRRPARPQQRPDTGTPCSRELDTTSHGPRRRPHTAVTERRHAEPDGHPRACGGECDARHRRGPDDSQDGDPGGIADSDHADERDRQHHPREIEPALVSSQWQCRHRTHRGRGHRKAQTGPMAW